MRTTVLDNEKELLQLIANGDQYAFAEIFTHYRDPIFSIALKITKSVITAEELVQHVFLTIWLKRADLNDINNFSAYLFVITRNAAYKALTKIARNYKIALILNGEQPAVGQDAADRMIEKEYDRILQSAIERLPGQQKQVYRLIKEHGLKREEVAHQLEIQPETVKFHLAQAMKNIRAFCMLHLGAFSGFLVVLFRLFGNN